MRAESLTIPEPLKDIHLTCLTIAEVDYHWPHIRSMLVQVPHIWAAECTLDGLYIDALSGDIQIWAVGRGMFEMVIFTKIYTTRVSRVAQIFLALGTMRPGYIERFTFSFEKWAIDLGVEDLEVVGREGWERLLKPLGGKRVHSTFRRKVDRMKVN